VALPAPAGATVRLGDIAVSGSSVIVVGAAEGTPMAWTLGDSGTWAGEVLEGDLTIPYAVVAMGDRIVAVGQEQSSRCAHPGNEVVWVRDRAHPWGRTPFAPIFCAAGGARAVATDGKRVVVTGVNAGDVGFSMVSDDGKSWREGDLPLGSLPVAMVADGDGFTVTGVVGDRSSWWYGWSEDGERWHIAAIDAPVLEPVAIASGDGGTVIWGSRAEGRIEAASLIDLAAWRIAPVPELDDLPNIAIETAHRPFIASGGDPGSGRAFVSNDGVSWNEIEVPHNGATRARIGHLVVVGDRVYAIASIPTPDDEIQVLVSAPLSVLGG
jgi:hypothetical protein